MLRSLTLLLIFIFTSQLTIAQSKNYGKKVIEKAAITMPQLVTQMAGKKEMDATVTGKVSVVCQMEGCWMKVANAGSADMMVR